MNHEKKTPFTPKTRQSLIKSNLELRARIIQTVRSFFIDKNYIEVETPCRIPAPAPEVHIEAPPSGDWFLHASPELCMKRLLSAGYPRIFQICKCFRQNERGERHIPEFTILEWYTEACDYLEMMDQCEELLGYVAYRTGFRKGLIYQGNRVDIAGKWEQMKVSDAFVKYAAVSMEEAVSKDRFDETMAFQIESNLGFQTPLFLYDYPSSESSLARLKSSDNSLAERFELYIAGIEICNGFTELTDPEEQRQRFEKDMKTRKIEGKKPYPMPEKFLEALESMPKAAGNALGIDRLVMLFADAATIDEVSAFTPEEL